MKIIKSFISAYVIFLLFILILMSPGESNAGSLDYWHWRNPLPQGNTFYGVIYGNGIFVTVGGDGTIFTSSDGVTWTSRTSGSSSSLSGVTYGNGKFVTVGQTGIILTSPDGITWTSQTSGITSWLGSVTYGNGTFIAVGEAGTIFTSSNGVTWTSRTSGSSSSLGGVTYGNGIFIAVGQAGTILTSPDGIAWTSQTSGVTGWLSGVTYGNGVFIAVGGEYSANQATFPNILTSVDGVTWAFQTTGVAGWPNSLFGVTYGNGVFVSVGGGYAEMQTRFPTVLTSQGGATWTSQTLGATILSRLCGVTYGNGKFVAVGEGGTILTSLDGVTWKARTSGTTSSICGVTYGNGKFVAVGEAGTILASVDGVMWAYHSSGTASLLSGITYGNGKFVVVGGDYSLSSGEQSQTILTSMDGVTWMSQSSGTTSSLSSVTFSNSKFVAVGCGQGTILTSVDGVTWTSRTTGTGCLNGVTYGNGKFVAVDYAGTMLTSTDGMSWTSQTTGTNQWLGGVTYGNGKFIAVGSAYSEGEPTVHVLTSTDGMAWTAQTTGITGVLYGVTYGNGIFVAVGYPGIILTSADGVIWTPQSSVTDNMLFGVTYGNDTFVVVGYAGSILQSLPLSSQFTLTVASYSPNSGVNITVSPNDNTGQSSGTTQFTRTYDSDIPVTLSAPSTEEGNTFSGWNGCDSTSGTNCYVTMNADRQVTAAFQAQSGNPKISIKPASLNFGSLKAGSTSASKTITVKNTGKGTLIIDSITIAGTNAEDFALTNSCNIIPPGGSCAISVTFTSTTPFGKKSAILSISSNDPKKPIVNVKLTGQAPLPKISVSPKSVNFGSIKVDNTSTLKVVTIKNTGISDLEIGSITISGTNASEFSQTNTCTAIPKGSSCAVTVAFSPASAGGKSALLSVSSNDPKKAVVNIKLTGKGTGTSGGGGGGAPEASAVIGPAGGTVEVTNPSSLLYGVKVEIPAGALNTDTNITISIQSDEPTLPTYLKKIGPMISLTPDGTFFNIPVTISIPFNSNIVTDKDMLGVYTYDKETSSWDILTLKEMSTGEIKVLTNHFSPFQVGEDIEPPPDDSYTGFWPSTDGFSIKNFPAVLPDKGGHCWGMVAYAKWYFEYKPSDDTLAHKYSYCCNYDENCEYEEYYCCEQRSVIIETQHTIPAIRNTWYLPQNPWNSSQNPRYVATALMRGISKSGKPQPLSLSIYSNNAPGHAILVWGYDGDISSKVTFYIYDPNYPLVDDITITYEDSQFKPYGYYNEFQHIVFSSLFSYEYKRIYDLEMLPKVENLWPTGTIPSTPSTISATIKSPYNRDIAVKDEEGNIKIKMTIDYEQVDSKSLSISGSGSTVNVSYRTNYDLFAGEHKVFISADSLIIIRDDEGKTYIEAINTCPNEWTKRAVWSFSSECANLTGTWSGNVIYNLSQNGCKITGTKALPPDCCGNAFPLTGDVSGDIFTYSSNFYYVDCDTCAITSCGAGQTTLTFISGNEMVGGFQMNCPDRDYDESVSVTRSSATSTTSSNKASKRKGHL